MIKQYHQPDHEGVTSAVDKLQQEVSVTERACGCPQCRLQARGPG